MENRARSFHATVLACAALFTGNAVSAPHAQVQMEDVTIPTPAMDVWLRRLVGHYSVEGFIEMVFYEPESGHSCGQLPPDPAQESQPPVIAVPFCQVIKGGVDCVGIGTGPGVQCILDAAWRDIYDGIFNLPGGEPYLSPAMALFGLDPGKGAIDYLLVDHKGLPEGGPGLVKGNRATFRTACVNGPVLLNAMNPDLEIEDRPPRTCDRAIYLDAKPEARLVNVMIDIEINEDPFTRLILTLRRQIPEAPAETTKPAPVRR